MGCNCGGSPRPRRGTSPGSTEYPEYPTYEGHSYRPPRDQLWHVWFPGAPEATEFSHEWQANAAHINHGGRFYPPGTLPNTTEEGSPL